MAGLFKQDKGGVKPSGVGTSKPQNTAVGSSSRPTPSKIPLPSSAPADPYGLDGRKTGNAMK